MAFAFIEQHARTWPVRLMCRVLAVSPSGYYSWRSRPESARLASNRQLLDDVRRIHAEHHGRYVAPRVHTALRAEGRAALPALHDRQPSRLAGRAEPPEAGFLGLATRHGLAGGYHLSIPTGEGWLYLATVLDLATHKIVGWSMRDHMRSELTVAALMMARQRQRWATRDETKRDLFAYLEGYYNRRRIHSALGYITPEQAERNAN